MTVPLGGHASSAMLAAAENLGKHWADGVGLRPLTFTLSAGELVVVRGRSGSGKSTLLALLAGWTEPDRGTLTRLGPWSGGANQRWSGTAIVPQVLAPIAELTTTENVALPLRLGGSPWPDARARALLDIVDLADEAERAATDASMGQQQRMALARAAIVDPAVLLVDEPTSHQDAGHVATVLAVLRSVVTAGTCAVVASHDPVVAAAADRVLDLDG